MDFKLSILRLEAKRYSMATPATRIRFLALIELCKRVDSGKCHPRVVDFESIGARFGKSGRSVQRWHRAWLKQGSAGLLARKAPGRHADPIRGHTALLIVEYVKRYGWGSQLIQIHLKYEHGIELGAWRIRRFLKRKGLIRIRRVKKKKIHTRKVVVQVPGAHTQMDVKYFPKKLKGGRQLYVYNFRDHATRWTYKRAYESIGAYETVEFMREVIARFPFKIYSVQTDNGGEFTYRHLGHPDKNKDHPLDVLCREHRIRHRLIPVGEKELQGLVERSHREDDEELFHRITPQSAGELDQALQTHCIWANHQRRRSALGWKTAHEHIQELLAHPQKYEAELAQLKGHLHHWLEPRNQALQPETRSST